MQTSGEGTSHFLPATRTDPSALTGEIDRATRSPLVTALLEAVEGAAVVVDRNRQAVAFNTAYLSAAGVEEPAQALGLRPGEALGCAHVQGVATGCGTTQACPSCGAAIAMLSALREGEGHGHEHRCALSTTRNGTTLDREFRVRATPFQIEGEAFILLTLQDVTDEARRAMLARSFVHDLSNLVCGLQSATEELSPGEGSDAADDLRMLAQQIVREVRLQKLMANGMHDDVLVLARGPAQVSEAISFLRRVVERHPARAGREVDWPEVSAGLTLPADPALLHHVLTNMVLNALEAVPSGARIRVEVVSAPGEVCLRVWNPGAIPAAVIPRIFQRYFTTKEGTGRGHGTWSMKTFGEGILGGKVSFQSSAEQGTWFQIALPRARP